MPSHFNCPPNLSPHRRGRATRTLTKLRLTRLGRSHRGRCQGRATRTLTKLPLTGLPSAILGLLFGLSPRASGHLALSVAIVAFSATMIAATPPVSAAPAVTLAPTVVTTSRLPQPADNLAATVHVLAADELQAAPTATLDGALRNLPGFSLFRRSDSLTANPTAQGVSLRGLGPSGASRSLVLLDGIPLNDPFGGWVAWTKVPRENLLKVEVIPGGGASAWGNAALGGVVQVLTRTSEAPETLAAATIGDFGTRSFEFTHTQPSDHGTFEVAANSFATDGFSLVAPERRGPIDLAAWSRHRWLSARWSQALNDTMRFAATLRGYEEKRSNGTPYQRNGTREKFGSVTGNGQPHADFAWNVLAYAQDQSFASTFSGVNAARTSETPASDQFNVPALAMGAAATGSWRHPGEAHTSAGFDARYVRGETREYFTFTAGNFTRLRTAGGQQAIAGLFALHSRPLGPRLHATLGTRLDRWQDRDGHRQESDRTTGIFSRNERYADRDGTSFSPSLGLIARPLSHWRIRGSAQQAYRRPTLNELYRPFRIGANVTEANAALRTERVTSGELGTEWSWRAAPAARHDATAPRDSAPDPATATRPFAAALTLGVTVFIADLHDAVGNVTLARGPGTFPIVGALAAGGIGRQRLNLERTLTQGLELAATWNLHADFSLNAAALGNDATIRRATVAPALVGRQVAQVPRRSATLGATWRAPGQLTFTPRMRWIGRQFEDDENTLRLGETVVADLGVTRPLNRHLTFFVTLENLRNARIETGRSADGVVNLGTPRLLLGGVRGRW
jgi:outer membrane receptor protein involved in Fe transport